MATTTDDMIAQAWPLLSGQARSYLIDALILGAIRPLWPDAEISGGCVCPTSDDDDPDGRCYVVAEGGGSRPGAWVHHPSVSGDEPGFAWLAIVNDDPADLARRVADLLAPFAGQPIPGIMWIAGGES